MDVSMSGVVLSFLYNTLSLHFKRSGTNLGTASLSTDVFRGLCKKDSTTPDRQLFVHTPKKSQPVKLIVYIEIIYYRKEI